MDLNSSLLQPSPQYAITIYVCLKSQLIKQQWLDGKHVVFGEVLEGYEVCEKIENVPKGAQDAPTKAVKIAKSGELEVPEGGTRADSPSEEL